MVDEAVLRRLVDELGSITGPVYGKNGKPYLLNKLNAYNQAARFTPWVILIDLDHDDDCAPPYRKSCLPHPAPYMCFRVAVRETEAWLLADRERLAKFLSVGVSRIPLDPERLDSPKSTMVEVARHSRRRGVREDMVPRTGSGRKIGPAYTSLLIEFARDSRQGWRPDVAAKSSDSLKRCMRRLEQLIGGPNEGV
jgi:hypothetical protein